MKVKDLSMLAGLAFGSIYCSAYIDTTQRGAFNPAGKAHEITYEYLKYPNQVLEELEQDI